jgi:hypothetical protein
MRLLAALLACLLPLPTCRLMADRPSVRHVSTAGTVWINAAALPSGSSLYDGDTLATATDGFAMITGGGPGRVEVRQDSLVSIGRQEITLRDGVVGSDGAAVRLGEAVIRPAIVSETRPWFVVAHRDGKQLVAAYEGDVLIALDRGKPVLVPRGSFAVPTSNPSDSKGTRDASGSSIPNGADSGWMIFSLSSAAGVAIIVALGATAAVATIVGYTLGENSVSPSN